MVARFLRWTGWGDLGGVFGRPQLAIYGLMFSILIFLNVDFAILRSMRSALVVADIIGSASYIPCFELFGTLPAAVLMTYGLGRLLHRTSIQRVFGMALATFILFFLLSTFVLYPNLATYAQAVRGWSWLPAHDWFASLVAPGFCLLFYVMSELWKVGLITLLFWGLMNRHFAESQAKVLYVPLMLAGSVGAMLASPCIQCSAFIASWMTPLDRAAEWNGALVIMTLWVTLLGLLSVFAYSRLECRLSAQGDHPTAPGEMKPKRSPTQFTLWESVRTCLGSRSTFLLAWIVVVEYVAYSVGEVIFLEVLKERFPAPVDYCAWMGNLSLLTGLLTALCALFVAPWVLRTCRWAVAALATPIGLLVSQAVFYAALLGLGSPAWLGIAKMHWIEIIVLVGSLQYSLCRAIKYTLFDPSKELVFVLMPPEQQIRSKLVIDGICARVGRGGAAIFSVSLIQLFGSIAQSIPVTSCIALSMTVTWIMATAKLGRLVDRRGGMEKPLVARI